MARQGLAEEPLTCHPGIDSHTYIGSSACVEAYPEHATRLVSGTTGLMDQDHSNGPDACEAACPIEAIQPGFMTENCGIDLPFGTPAVATNAPGIFLAGELAGMGLICTKSDQGTGAIESIRGEMGAPISWMR
jgi:thioredoxin reductase (NADPH)